MEIGNFYFLSSDYFIDFPDDKLMSNKEMVQGVAHDRPCFYAFYDTASSLYWLIPFSSQVSKFKSIYQKKIDTRGKCDTIAFGNVPVKLDGVFEKELISKAKKVLALNRRGSKLIFPDVLKIEKELIKKLNE